MSKDPLKIAVGELDVTVDADKLDAMIESAVYELKNGSLMIEGGTA